MGARDLIAAIRERDPAKPSVLEVVLAYPGFHIMALFHPAAHFLWQKKWRAAARVWAHIGRMLTGIEIHPAATIGRNLFIDHGMGTVIGETAVVGDDCTLYHGVTLGGKSGSTDGPRRHPHLGDNVIIGAGSQVLGAITLGNGARVGANAVVTSDIPDGVTVVGNPARALGRVESPHCAYGLPEGVMRDPRQDTIDRLERELQDLRKTINL